MNRRRTTLADIARKAGVHVTTVSRCLRNYPRIPPDTRAQIQELAEQMGYMPDPYLRTLVSYRCRTMLRKNPPTLAYLTNWNTRNGWKNVTGHPQFYAGARAKATELGFKLEHFRMGEPGLTPARLNRTLRTRGISGLIIASHTREFAHTLELDWEGFSAVKIDYLPHQPALHNVTNNQCGVIRLAMQRVMAAGYRRVGFVMHRGMDHNVNYLWTAGFLGEQANLHRADRIPMLHFPKGDSTDPWMAGIESDAMVSPLAFRRWYEEYRPQVIISKSSFVQLCIAEIGLRIPQDVAFVDVFLEDTSARIAGVRQNHEEVGGLAVEILTGQLHHNLYGVPQIATTTFVEGTWLDGASCPMSSNTPSVSSAVP